MGSAHPTPQTVTQSLASSALGGMGGRIHSGIRGEPATGCRVCSIRPVRRFSALVSRIAPQGVVMIVVLKPAPTAEMIQRVVQRVEGLGLKAHVIVGTERTVVAAVGNERNGAQQELESCDEVEKVLLVEKVD